MISIANLATESISFVFKSAEPEVEILEIDTPQRKLCRSRWAAMIKKVYEANPLKCPKCGEQMLQHCNLWKEPESRAPPTCPHHPVFPGCRREFNLEPEYIPMDEFLADF